MRPSRSNSPETSYLLSKDGLHLGALESRLFPIRYRDPVLCPAYFSRMGEGSDSMFLAPKSRFIKNTKTEDFFIFSIFDYIQEC